MMNQQEVQSFEVSEIQRHIMSVCGIQVMLDRDLAALYGVEVKQLNRQVKRNIERFPGDFMFQLTKEDCLRCQIGTLNGKRGEHLKYMPYAFTENGIAMLSGVLNSPTAIEGPGFVPAADATARVPPPLRYRQSFPPLYNYNSNLHYSP